MNKDLASDLQLSKEIFSQWLHRYAKHIMQEEATYMPRLPIVIVLNICSRYCESVIVCHLVKCVLITNPGTPGQMHGHFFKSG